MKNHWRMSEYLSKFLLIRGLFIFLAIYTPVLLKAQQPSSEQLSTAISNGDEAFRKGDFRKALEYYQNASSLKPGDTDIAKKIENAGKAVKKAETRSNLSFEDAILEGERLLKQKDYPGAKKQFENALGIDPESRFAKDKLAEIRKVYKDPADLARFNEVIQKGNSDLGLGNFDKARDWFREAAALQPENKTVRDKIAETDRRQTEARANKLLYDQLMAEAEKLLAANKQEDALTKYRQAADLYPADPAASLKVKEIETGLNEKKALQEAYDKAIELGDQFYINRDFINAKLRYQDALKLKPQARYPKEMLEKSGQGETQQLSVKERYDAVIASADQLFGKGDPEGALPLYRSALELMPGSEYPAERMAAIEKSIEEKNNRKSAYDIAISNGDQAFSIVKYETALSHYKNALSLLPDQQYPKDKINEINGFLGKQKELDAAYQKSIAAADNRMKEKKYPEATQAYQDALNLKPGETYPKEKLDEISRILGEAKAKEEAYSDAINQADQALKEKKYEAALGLYKQAAASRPSESYPKQKIAEVNTLITTAQNEEARFNQLVNNADKAFDKQEYSQSLINYKDALKMRPASDHVIGRIAEIEGLLSDAREKKELYAKAIAEADRLLGLKEYEPALRKYSEAQKLQPAEKYATQKITEINTLLDTFRQTESAYTTLIAKADSAFTAAQFNASLEAYQSALKLKPSEKYPQDQISAIRNLIAEKNKLDADFDKAIFSGDQLLEAKKYPEAITAYEEALRLKPGEAYPGNQINVCNTLITRAKELRDAYVKAVEQGDALLAGNKLNEAKNAFLQAQQADPAEAYPAQKIGEIDELLGKAKVSEENYRKAISDGDFFYNAGKYREALEPYERALTILPVESYPKTQKEKIFALLEEQQKKEDQYTALVKEGDQLLEGKKYRESLAKFGEASALLTEKDYPKEKIRSIQKILDDLALLDENYNKALAEGDSRLASKDLPAALDGYRAALKLKPAETYPADKIKNIQAEIERIENSYRKVVADADNRLVKKEYSEAISLYQQAREIKPEETYPAAKIAEIKETLEKEKEELEKLYTSSVAEGDQLLAALDYYNAKKAFVKASGLKPAEKYPKDKLLEINLVLDARAKAVKDEFDKAIVDADKLYLQKILDQAVDAYEKAAAIKPDEAYPVEMIRKIRQYITDHSILQVNTAVIVIPSGDEHKFSFKGIEPRLRSNNYVMIRAKSLSDATPKVYFNYGRDNAKNGGVVLRTITNKEGVDYLIRLAGQDTWYREDNNWFSLYTEGSDLEVSKIEISQGD